MIDILWQKFLIPEFGAKFQKEVSTLILKLPEFPYNTV